MPINRTKWNNYGVLSHDGFEFLFTYLNRQGIVTIDDEEWYKPPDKLTTGCLENRRGKYFFRVVN